MDAPSETSDPCTPEDVLHDGHIVYTVEQPSARRGFVLWGWQCANCPKRSRTWTLRKQQRNVPGI